ncbi:MAG: hypothetical protein IIC93_09320 [Chloroflexi bacterium]|nr:hypothetical protein [Chloroflexota bacterium]
MMIRVGLTAKKINDSVTVDRPKIVATPSLELNVGADLAKIADASIRLTEGAAQIRKKSSHGKPPFSQRAIIRAVPAVNGRMATIIDWTTANRTYTLADSS